MNVLSDKGAAALRLHEGFVGRAYFDPIGVLTLGIGFTWRSGAFRSWWHANRRGPFDINSKMTRVEADDCLQYICRYEYGKAVNEFFGPNMAQHRFDGCTSVVYNLGPGALNWKWAHYIKAGNIKEGARRLRSTGVTADGVRLPGLVRRRKEESILIEYGTYIGVDTSPAPAAPADALADGVLRRGEAGPPVAQLIKDLKKLGHYHGVMDDIFGYGTESAVMEFQRSNGLAVDGVAGPKTLEKIRLVLGRSATVGAHKKKGTAVAAGSSAVIAGLYAFACKIPLLSSLFEACTK